MTLEVVRIGAARFWIDEGMYSIEQVEQMLADFKETKRKQDEALARSIERKEEIAANFFNAAFNLEKPNDH
jgi:hypothetical protein